MKQKTHILQKKINEYFFAKVTPLFDRLTATTATTGVFPSVPTVFVASPFLIDPSWQPAGAAQRRKQRRPRSWLRPEKQSIAAALATFKAPLSATGTEEGQRVGEEDFQMNCTTKIRTHPPPQAGRHSVFCCGRQTGSHPYLVRRSGFCGTPGIRSSTVRRTCRLLMFLVRLGGCSAHFMLERLGSSKPVGSSLTCLSLSRSGGLPLVRARVSHAHVGRVARHD